MAEHPTPTRWLQRLADEFDDDGIELPADPEFCRLLLEELDHCRRAPMFEGRRPTYGAIIVPRDRAVAGHRAALDALDYDLVPLDDDLAAGRAYADGRASYLVRSVGGGVALACFSGSMLMEADLVRLQRETGAAIIQRTPVLDVVRVAVDEAMITWDGRHWRRRPTAMALADVLLERVPELDRSLANHVLELAVHWLAPSRIGATVVVHDGDDIDWSSLDTSTAARTPQLSVCDRRHFSALSTVLRQHDLAVIVDRDGSLRKVAVGLRWTPDAEGAVTSDRGMRHRSAQRYSHDHPTATLVVVSEDGPVSVFRGGAVVVTSAAHTVLDGRLADRLGSSAE